MEGEEEAGGGEDKRKGRSGGRGEDITPLKVHTLPSSPYHTQSVPTPPHHHTTHSPHRNNVLRKDGEVSGSPVECQPSIGGWSMCEQI